MKFSTLKSGLCSALVLAAIPVHGREPTAEEKAVGLEDICRQPNGRKARPPKMRGFYIGRALFSPKDITKAQAGIDEYTDESIVVLTFSKPAALRFKAITTQYLRQTLAIFLDGQLLSCPIVNEPISGGHVQINGNLSAAKAEQLVSHFTKYKG
jgi:preprotein translocase subunit SecD